MPASTTTSVRAIYAYAVCLVAIITLLLSVSGLVSSVMDLRDPLHANDYRWSGHDLSSFEMFKVSVLTSPQRFGESTVPTWIPDDDTLRAMYDTARDEHSRNIVHDASQKLITHAILLVVSVLLFGVHWLRVRPRNGKPA